MFVNFNGHGTIHVTYKWGKSNFFMKGVHMHLNRNMAKAGLLVLTVVSGVILGGCAAAAPPPEAILAGNWSLTTDQPSLLPPTTVTFDSNGNFTQITYEYQNATITQIPINGSTLVSGDTVTISESLDNGSSLNFVGTINSAGTQIKGNLVATLNITSIFVVQFNGVPATLTKQ